MIIYILFILFVLLILFVTKSNTIEGYDARYTNTTFPQCAEFCKTIANCYGFGYDQKNKICYPSQTNIFGLPTDSIFKDSYSYYNATCNKINPIINPATAPPFDQRRANSVYTCSETYDKQPQYYFHNKNEITNIGEGKNIDTIFDVDSYSVRNFVWPKGKFDYDQIDILMKDRENQTFVPNNITDINRIINYTPQYQPIQYIDKPITNKGAVQLDFGLQKIKNYVDTRLMNPPTIPFVTNNAIPNYIANYTAVTQQPGQIPRKNNNYTEINLYNNGEYLHNYKCQKDIKLDECLEYCSNNAECIGVEWNPEYNTKQFCKDNYDNYVYDPVLKMRIKNLDKKNNNVCCPYKKTGLFVPRNNETRFGKFYLKS